MARSPFRYHRIFKAVSHSNSWYRILLIRYLFGKSVTRMTPPSVMRMSFCLFLFVFLHEMFNDDTHLYRCRSCISVFFNDPLLCVWCTLKTEKLCISKNNEFAKGFLSFDDKHITPSEFMFYLATRVTHFGSSSFEKLVARN